jgi:hypothetical protein
MVQMRGTYVSICDPFVMNLYADMDVNMPDPFLVHTGMSLFIFGYISARASRSCSFSSRAWCINGSCVDMSQRSCV